MLLASLACLVPARAIADAATYGRDFEEQRIGDEPYLARCGTRPTRILLFLHSWSADHRQAAAFPEFRALEDACVVAPNFNGPNRTPRACASEDAISRIEQVLKESVRRTGIAVVDLLGFSGGAYVALVFLGSRPGLVSSAGVWLPIYDLAQWFREATNGGEFQQDMIGCFGRGPAGPSDRAYAARSPSVALDGIRPPLRIWLNAGSRDTTTYPSHAQAARDHIARACPACALTYVEWDMAHEFRIRAALEQMGYPAP
ncbi:alpha/beta hydrolase family protein [Falsiroseomonas sp.]|uniref:alpha/beta hydrolase family protein n=1 Tax=Falsiroseomonas sp. TaxID=2870721 RepID=UPI003562C63C